MQAPSSVLELCPVVEALPDESEPPVPVWLCSDKSLMVTLLSLLNVYSPDQYEALYLPWGRVGLSPRLPTLKSWGLFVVVLANSRDTELGAMLMVS